VRAPTLVVHGDKTPEPLRAGSEALAQVLPNAELRVLAGTGHNISMKKLAPVLAEFFAGGETQP
jgi:pimeloyl-ACP methyl ester carboxylesterase